MQPIDYNELISNRERLIVWQQLQRARQVDGLRLNLGCGNILIPGYTNVDLYSPNADVKEDIRNMTFKQNSAIEIIAQQVLEHLPYRDVFETLKHWYNILDFGGTIEIGSPDIEFLFQGFLEGSDNEKWQKYIWMIYGEQTSASVSEKNNIRNKVPFNPGLVHMGGFSLGYMIRMLEDIGFRMIDAYNYDGYGAPCLFIYAMKPFKIEKIHNVLENDVAIGAFTNRTDYIVNLWESANKYLPHIPFITRINRDSIVKNMTLLREDFIKSGKRYFVYLDDDIEILNSDIIKNALELLIKNKYAIVSVYSTFDPVALTNHYSPAEKGLIAREHNFAVGYFICSDSWRIGNILPDLNLPDPNLAIDADFSVASRLEGFQIGISADYVYHLAQKTHPGIVNSQPTLDYFMNKYGEYYFDYTKYGGSVIEWNSKDIDFTYTLDKNLKL